MFELYLLTRFDNIANLAMLAIVFAVFFLLAFLSTASKEEKANFNAKRYLKIAMLVCFSGVLVRAFLPSTKEAFFIYGVGSGIEYLRNDSVAKQIPHKVIEACDAYLDGLKKEKNESK